MNKLLFAAVAAVTLGLAAPASAQFFVGADPGGVGVQVGPLGAGVGSRWGWDRPYHRWHSGYGAYAYGGDCRLVRERVMTPSGRMIIRTHRTCF
jgi:hypothetical protein